MIIRCSYCKKEFESKIGNNKFCSRSCRNNGATLNTVKYHRSDKLDNSSIGAASEMIVCANLLFKGFEVFKAISPSATWDLIAIKPEQPIAIKLQIKTVNRYVSNDKVSTPGTNALNYDCLVVVIPEENYIEYRPDLDSILFKASS